MKGGAKNILYKILFLIYILASTTTLSAQNKLGVIWQTEGAQNVENTISIFQNTSVKLVIIPGSTDNYIVRNLAKAEIPFLVDLNLEFFTKSKIEQHSDEISHVLESINIRYASVEAFSGFVVFKNSAGSFQNMDAVYSKILDSTELRDSLRFYEIYDSKLIPLASETEDGIILQFENTSPNTLHSFVEHISARDGFLFVDYEWLNGVLNNHEEFKEALVASDNLDSAVIPLKQYEQEDFNFSWPAILLLVCWVLLGIIIAANNEYKKSIHRYFFSHSFFVDDVIKYRDKAINGSIFLMMSHAVFSGLVVYFLARTLLTSAGVDALHYHFPILDFFGSQYFAFFTIAAIGVFLLQIVAIIWLALFNPKIHSLGQIISIYTWIFHVDFILVTIISVIYFAGGSETLLLVLSGIFLFIWYNAFTLTSLDASKGLGSKRPGYLLKTMILHFIVTILLIFVLMIFDDWFEVVKLAVNI